MKIEIILKLRKSYHNLETTHHRSHRKLVLLSFENKTYEEVIYYLRNIKYFDTYFYTEFFYFENHRFICRISLIC